MFRELVGNLKQGNVALQVAHAGVLQIDPVTGNIHVHDGVTAGGSVNATGTKSSYDVTKYSLVADGATDNSSAFTTLLAIVSNSGGGQIIFPASSAAYIFNPSAVITIPSNVNIVGLGRPTLRIIGNSTSQLFRINGGSKISIKNIVLDLNRTGRTTSGYSFTITNATDVLFEDVDFLGQPAEMQITGTSTLVKVYRCTFTSSGASGVALDGVTNCSVLNCTFTSSTYFGCIMRNGSYRNEFSYNRTITNGVELCGITQNCYENRVAFNHAEGTGDNGISVTGYKNSIVGNVVVGCQGNGIELYGDRNTCVGNVCLNNAQGNGSNAGWSGGISIANAFGGSGQYNTVTGNVCDDDQTVPTQLYGIRVYANSTSLWVTSTVYATGAYVYYGLNIYTAAVGGTSGASPPVHTSGSVSDGGVTWTYLRSYIVTAQASYNTIRSNAIKGYATASYVDSTTTNGLNIIDNGFGLDPRSTAIVVPDASSVAGNVRGANAIDFQGLRTSSGQVASGSQSLILGGAYNTASGAGATAGCGQYNIASGQYSVCLGTGNLSSGFNSLALGRHSSDHGAIAKLVFASEQLATNGDAQMGLQVLKVQTTNATATRLSADVNTASGNNSIPLTTNSAIHVWGRIIAHETATPANAVSWSVEALVTKGSTNSTLVVYGSTVTKLFGSTSWSSNTPTLTADTTDGSVSVTVTGAASTTINWVFTAYSAEVV